LRGLVLVAVAAVAPLVVVAVVESIVVSIISVLLHPEPQHSIT